MKQLYLKTVILLSFFTYVCLTQIQIFIHYSLSTVAKRSVFRADHGIEMSGELCYAVIR